MPILSPIELSNRVTAMLIENNAKFDLIQHEHEGSCIAVSKLRGNHPREAVKAMLISVKKSNKNSTRVLALLPGDASMDFKRLKDQLGVKSTGMAVRQDVIDLLDSEPGGVSPFSFNETVSVIIDEELTKVKNVFFSAGRTDESVTMPIDDFLRVSFDRGAKVLSFCNLPEENVSDCISMLSFTGVPKTIPYLAESSSSSSNFPLPTFADITELENNLAQCSISDKKGTNRGFFKYSFNPQKNCHIGWHSTNAVAYNKVPTTTVQRVHYPVVCLLM